MKNLICASFIFRPGQYDEEFHRLDKSIDNFAVTLPGFVGVERWLHPDGETKMSNYYFDNMQTVAEFSKFADHREAKSKYTNWYRGYQIVISQVQASYGDGVIQHLTQKN